LKKLKIPVSQSIGSVSALQVESADPKAILVLAHGAGAGMEHTFMTTLAGELQARHISTLRFNFPFKEQGKSRPDPPAVAEKTIRSMIEEAQKRFPEVPLFVSGKSFGGRMSSQLISKDCPRSVQGLVFFGFPLHAVGKPSIERAAHLKQIKIPMLFLQGTKDRLAEMSLIKKVVKGLPTATLKTFEGADHSFKVSKETIVDALADETSQWIDGILNPQ
jgi:uncharacterized protein